ncbi:MAG: Gfo/Idh/MocA family oxidoreductase [Geminicoccaceae bacterium]|nr:Gfo/Idh/MocA family oxidoreductase [Geminicoccaceae bacterium]MCS7266448.1 Gfo/Idh/MocA family oxidoreductase [Geminicoccaceae bacterium]MCX7630319.1 Gfo/Idh/MocA family oxidoreductase [Geminicoccaceae bacterium]MDW8123956.1 Gfo/Idh/MocA family oxidoreductase [Geminicoccaceae bacterium]MDW8342796.1 Gfo/Idh/MocA family oxidoreductase [Geminicoccaceae bacterium]
MIRPLRIGLVGSGFMGRSHALAWRIAPLVFELPVRPEIVVLADRTEELAAQAARQLAIPRATGDWRDVVRDPEVDLVDITTPNALHKEIALAAIEAGKAVYCEKPLAPSAADARELTEAAERMGLSTFVGFNYLRNPMTRLARELVASGEVGEVWNFRGIHAEDYMSDPGVPWSWRLDPAGGAGAVADLGSHIIAMARFIVGPIDELVADVDTVVTERAITRGGAPVRPVEVDDEARALVRFANGATGTIEASWVATGRKMYLAFELTGSKGSILLNMERMNELRLFVKGQKAGREGYVEIPAGPDHVDYAAFLPAPAHQLGFNEIKAIEVKDIAMAMGGGPAFRPDFREAYEIQRVVDAILLSARERRWVSIDEID